MERISEEGASIDAVVGAIGAVEFIQAYFAAADGCKLSFGVGFGRRTQAWAVIASCDDVTCALSADDARKAADILEKGLALFPNIPYERDVRRIAESFRECAEVVEQMTSGVKQ